MCELGKGQQWLASRAAAPLLLQGAEFIFPLTHPRQTPGESLAWAAK